MAQVTAIGRGAGVLALAALVLTACRFGSGSSASDGGPSDAAANLPDAGDGGIGPDAVIADAGDPDARLGPDANYPPPLIEGLGTLAGTEIGVLRDGDRDRARFNNPVNMVVDDDGSLLVADQDGSAIRRVQTAGSPGATTTLVPRTADFRRPFGLVRDGSALYVQTDLSTAGVNSGALWRVELPGGARTLVLEELGSYASRYRGLGVLSDGRLVLSNYLRHAIYVLDPATGVKTLLAGADGIAGFVDSAIGTTARFDEPYDLIVLPGDLILIADRNNHRLRLVTAAGAVSTYAGTGAAGSAGGPRLGATFNLPQGVAIDGAGNVYVTDTGSYRVRRIDPAGEVTTVAGNGVAGWADSEDPLLASFYGLEGAEASGGYLYISDGNRGDGELFHRIRRLTLP